MQVELQAFAILQFNRMVTFTVCIFIHVCPLCCAGPRPRPGPCQALHREQERWSVDNPGSSEKQICLHRLSLLTHAHDCLKYT